MEVIDKTNEKISFTVETNESLANAMRRSINEIPTVAVEEIEINRNDSALYDEIIAHRIGLIPFKEKRKIVEFKEGDKPTTKNQLQLSLKVKGPKTVYAEDFKGEIEPVYPKTPIVILGKDQEIELVAYARAGKGINHAKYSPGLVYYRNISEVNVKNVEEGKKLVEKLGKKILNAPKEIKSGSKFESVEDEDYLNTLVESKDSIEINQKEDLVFFIESWGQKDPKEIFSEAVKALGENLNEFGKKIKK